MHDARAGLSSGEPPPWPWAGLRHSTMPGSAMANVHALIDWWLRAVPGVKVLFDRLSVRLANQPGQQQGALIIGRCRQGRDCGWLPIDRPPVRQTSAAPPMSPVGLACGAGLPACPPRQDCCLEAHHHDTTASSSSSAALLSCACSGFWGLRGEPDCDQPTA